MIKVRRNSITAKEILLTLAKVGIFTIAATSPYFLHAVIKKYFKEISRKQKADKARKLRQLERRQLISISEEKKGVISIKMTHQGKIILRQYQLEDIRLDKSKKWDGKWRMIIYDIPHRQKRGRDALRKKIKQMGLYPLQKSIWVSPYDLIKELEFLCAIFDIALDRDVFYLTVNQIPKVRQIKSFFNLS